MDKPLIIFIGIFLFFLCLVTFLKVSLSKFNSQFKGELTQNEERVNTLFEFSYDIHFNEPPNNINIDNPFACTPIDLQPCTLSDPFSCSGCQSLIASCVHFAKDTKYIDAKGVETVIPKNQEPDEGYCLTQNNPTQACNPYHGNLVLVQTEPNATESMLYCECVNPGYIGKTEIDGACNEVFICNGEIDELNKPLEEINCICKDGLISNLTNGTPTCITPTVKDYTEYNTGLFYDNMETIATDRFNTDISGFGKFPGDQLINPCKYCLITGKYIANGAMVPTEEEDGGWQCVSLNSKARGLPIRRDPKHRILKGSAGPDSIIDVSVSKIYVHGYLNETTFEQMTAVLNINENKDILKYIDTDLINRNHAQAFIDLQPHQLVFPGSFGAMTIANFPGVACDGVQLPGWADDFAYTCSFVNSIPWDRRPRDHDSFNVVYSTTPSMIFDKVLSCPPKHHSILTGAVFKQWKHFEAYNSTHSLATVNGLVKYEISQAIKSSEYVKYICSVFNLSSSDSTHYGTNDMKSYKKWFAILIPKE